MISNLDQKVSQDKYDEEFDRIFNNGKDKNDKKIDKKFIL